MGVVSVSLGGASLVGGSSVVVGGVSISGGGVRGFADSAAAGAGSLTADSAPCDCSVSMATSSSPPPPPVSPPSSFTPSPDTLLSPPGVAVATDASSVTLATEAGSLAKESLSGFLGPVVIATVAVVSVELAAGCAVESDLIHRDFPLVMFDL